MFTTISKAAVLAVVAGSLNLTVAAPVQAQTVYPVADGSLCSFMTYTDPTGNGDVQTVEIDGGPLVATSTPGATISMACTLQVGAANATYDGADSAIVTSAPSLQVTAIPPTLASYVAPEGEPLYVCTEVTVDGVTWYWDYVNRGWSASSSVGCHVVIGYGDFFACAILPRLSPGVPAVVDVGPDGDLYVLGIWILDCRPHGNPLSR